MTDKWEPFDESEIEMSEPDMEDMADLGMGEPEFTDDDLPFSLTDDDYVSEDAEAEPEDDTEDEPDFEDEDDPEPDDGSDDDDEPDELPVKKPQFMAGSSLAETLGNLKKFNEAAPEPVATEPEEEPVMEEPIQNPPTDYKALFDAATESLADREKEAIEAKNKVSELEDKITGLENTIEDLNATIDENKRLITDKDAQIEELQRAEASTEEIDQLKEEKRNLEDTVKGLHEELARNVVVSNNLASQVNELTSGITERDQKLTDYDRIRKETQSLTAENERLKKDLEDANDRYEKANDKAKIALEQFKKLKENKGIDETDSLMLTEYLDRFDKQMDAFKSQVERLSEMKATEPAPARSDKIYSKEEFEVEVSKFLADVEDVLVKDITEYKPRSVYEMKDLVHQFFGHMLGRDEAEQKE